MPGEQGNVSPGTDKSGTSPDDVVRLVRLCGLDLELAVVPRDDSDMAQAW
ncbi:hypothetical protein ACWDTP_14485 [Mycobacterium sp. NPDC003449]